MTLQEVIKELQTAPDYKIAERKLTPGVGFYLRYLLRINGVPEHALCSVSRFPVKQRTDIPPDVVRAKQQRRYPGATYGFTDREVLADDWQVVGEENEEIAEKYHYGADEEE